METVTIILALMFAVLTSDWLARFLPIPLPLLQIALGALLAIGPLPSVELNSEIFFLVFLPPLLFLDGWRIPKRDLFRDGRTILALALGLVLLTVTGIGLFVHWLIPTMPLAVAFALAAVLSPTDPIAVSAVATRGPIPHRLMHILEGEALLNDASGLVCLRFAIAAAMTGTFSLVSAGLTFLWLALGGVAVGIGLTIAMTFVGDKLLRRAGEDPGTETLFSLLIPFAVYLAAESVHVSGILAAVAAGITMNYVENLGRALALTRMRRTAVWDTVQLAANGSIFVLLGEQLPDILSAAALTVKTGEHHTAWWLPAYVVAITMALIAIRFVWVSVSIRLFLFKARRRGETAPTFTWHFVAVTAVAGVKGAITLAGVLTLPLLLPNGAVFPARDLAVFLAMGVILLSLITASATLPRLLTGVRVPPESIRQAEEERAREVAGQIAMQAIEHRRLELARERIEIDHLTKAAARAMERYNSQALLNNAGQETKQRYNDMANMERDLSLAGLRAERDALYRLRREDSIEDEVLRRLVREVDLLEARYESLSDSH